MSVPSEIEYSRPGWAALKGNYASPIIADIANPTVLSPRNALRYGSAGGDQLVFPSCIAKGGEVAET